MLKVKSVWVFVNQQECESSEISFGTVNEVPSLKLHLSNQHGLRLTSDSTSGKVGVFVEDVTFDNFRLVKVKTAKRTQR